MPTVSCSVRRAYPFYTERNFKKLLIDVLIKAGTRINTCTEFVARTGFNSCRDVINVKKLNNLIFSCLSHNSGDPNHVEHVSNLHEKIWLIYFNVA